jgi:hypothetical protein
MSGCDRLLLESLVLGELGAEPAREVERHAASCAHCRGELAWLRLERGAASYRRRDPPAPRLSLPAIEAAAEHRERRTFRSSWMATCAALGTAAFVAVIGAGQLRPAGGGEIAIGSWSCCAFLAADAECRDLTSEAIAALESEHGACLTASPGDGAPGSLCW